MELVVVAAVYVLVVQICPGEPRNIPPLNAVDVVHAPQSVCAKDDALANMTLISFTLETSHLDISPLKDGARENMASMLVTLDTFHLEMSPLNNLALKNM